MTLVQLRVFVKVAELEHMTRAAGELNLAQSAASAAVAALEAEYAVKLFHRVGRSIRLTSHGTALLAQARTVLQLVQRIPDRVQNIKEETIPCRSITL